MFHYGFCVSLEGVTVSMTIHPVSIYGDWDSARVEPGFLLIVTNSIGGN